VVLDTASGEDGRGDPVSGVLRVLFDRVPAMRRAGRVTAAFLVAGEETDRNGESDNEVDGNGESDNEVDGNGGSESALLLGLDTNAERRAELDAFTAGFNGLNVENASRLEERRFESLPSPDAIRRIFRDLGETYRVVVVFLGERSAYAVEQALDIGLPYGGENLGLFDSSEQRMLFSVESRISEALEAYVDAAEPMTGRPSGDDSADGRMSGVLVTEATLLRGNQAPEIPTSPQDSGDDTEVRRDGENVRTAPE
jgi:hypothetical protein